MFIMRDADFFAVLATYDLDDNLDNDARLLNPCSPLHPLWDDVRGDFLRDWQVD
jgi:hypothetical protein